MENMQVKMLDVCMLKDFCNRIEIQKQDLNDYIKECPSAVFGAILLNDDIGNIIDGRNGYWIPRECYDWLDNDDGTERWALDEDISVGYLILEEYNDWLDLTDDIIDVEEI